MESNKTELVLVPVDGSEVLRLASWGLVPYWAKDMKIGYKAINARAETVDEKPMFREAFKRRRCPCARQRLLRVET